MSQASKTLLGVFFFSALATASIASPKIEGHWEGAVTRDGSVQVIAVDFGRAPGEAKTKLGATIDIPELGMFHEPMSEVKQEGSSLRFRFIYGTFECFIHPDVAEITGVNSKWGPPLRIHLKRLPRFRPPVRQEDVRFRNGSITLAGTLLRPRGSYPVPAVVCVHGSDQATREEWTYRGIGFALARSGFAALIFDRRGNGASTGSASDATFDDFAADAVAAVEYLKTRKDIQGKGIGIFGASQGGWIGPLAASKSGDIAYVIAHAGPAVSVWEQERDRIEFGMKADGAAADDIQAALALSDQIFDFVRSGRGWDSLSLAVQNAKKEKWASYLQLPEKPEDALTWRQQEYDPAPVLRKLKTPILALFGEDDTLVPPSKNVARFQRYLSEAGNHDVTIHVFPDVGHGMELQRTLREDDWKWPTGYWVWSRKAPGYHQMIVDWIDRQVQTTD